jgi:predicted RNA-binding protein
MCESSAFRIKDGKKIKIMDNVALISVEDEKVTISGILGETKTLTGRIVRVDSESHEVYIR